MTAQAASTKSSSHASGLLGSRAVMVLVCSLYVLVFVLVYRRVIVSIWGYEGFHDRAKLGHAAVGWVLAAFPSLWMPIKLKRPSQVAYWMLYLLVLVPSCLVPIYALDDQSTGPLFLALCLVVVFALMSLIYRVPLLPLHRVHIESYEFSVILAILSMACYALMVSAFGFHFHYVSFEETYSVRAQFQETLTQVPSIVAYAIGWQAWVINPFIIAVGLRSRRTSWILAGAAGQFAVYSITAFRSMLFSTCLLLYLLWLLRSVKTFGSRLVITWTAIFAGTGASLFFGYGLMAEALVGVRMTALPGLLTGYYYEFFSSHPQAHLGHSILKSLVDYPYAVEPPYLIGSIYFHSASNDANANIWADAYANFGYAGIICFTVLLAILLWLYDSMAASSRDVKVAALAIGLPAFALANGGLLTSLLTNGVGLAMLLVYLMPPIVRGHIRRTPLLVAATNTRL
jgi:hypothetical protein